MQAQSPLGEVTRDGGLATVQLFDLYFHLVLPSKRMQQIQNPASNIWPLSAAGEKKRQKQGAAMDVRDGRMTTGAYVTTLFQKEFGKDISRIRLTSKGEAVTAQPKSLKQRIVGKSSDGLKLPYSDGSGGNKRPFSRIPDDEVASGGQQGYSAPDLIDVANFIDSQRGSILSKLRAALADQSITSAYMSGDYFAFVPSRLEAKGGDFSDFVTGAWKWSDAKDSAANRTLQDHLNALVALLNATSVAEPGEVKRSSSSDEATPANIDKVASQSSGMRAKKVAGLIAHMVGIGANPSSRTAKNLNDAQIRARSAARAGFRTALEQAANKEVPTTGSAARDLYASLRHTYDVEAALKSKEGMGVETAADNARIHAFLSSALRSSGLTKAQFLEGIWVSFSDSGIKTPLEGHTLKPLGSKGWVASPQARTYMLANGQFGSVPQSMSAEESSRYAFDRLLSRFIDAGAQGDFDGEIKFKSNARSTTRSATVGLKDSTEKDFKAFMEKVRQGAPVEKELAAVMGKVMSGKYNSATLRALAVSVGAVIPEKAYFRDSLVLAIREKLLAVYLDAAEANNRGAIAVVAACLKLGGDAMKPSANLEAIVTAIRAKLDAQGGIMSVPCGSKMLTTEDLKTIGAVNGVSTGTAGNREELCDVLANAGVKPQAGKPLSSIRVEPAPKTIKVTSGSRSATVASSPRSGSQGSSGFQPVFNSAPAQVQQNAPIFTPSGMAPFGGMTTQGSGSQGSQQASINALLQGQGSQGTPSFQFN